MNMKNSVTRQRRYAKRRSIIMGTAILTIAGFITRFIGFFYRIYLSNTMGAEKLGIYQLVFPVYGICFTLYASGIQTSISRLVAAELGKKNYKNIHKILKIGLIMSVSIAIFLSILVYINANSIAMNFLMEARSASSLRVLAFVFPFCGVTSCINGYYYGLKKAGVPASTQLLEQVTRVIVVYLVALYAGNGDQSVTCELAIFGVVIGEIVSCLYNFFSLFYTKSPKELILFGANENLTKSSSKKIATDLFHLSAPLSGNRLIINILHSIEAVLIPNMLRKSGLSTADALSVYGVLNGMAIPFILFPTAVINALAVLLLPTISEAQATNNEKLIGRTTSVSIKYSIIIGILSTGIFVVFGKALGNNVFHNESAGAYLVILAWLCPFVYLTTTLGSIINGLGKTHITFFNSVTGLLIKILLILVLIPNHGITGYLIGLLISQLIVTSMDSYAIIRNIKFSFHAMDCLLKPGLIIALSGFMMKEIYEYIQKMTQMNEVVLLLSFCLILCVLYFGLLITTNAISRKDFK